MIDLFLLLLMFNAYTQGLCLDKKNCMLEQSKGSSSLVHYNILGSKLETCSKKPMTGFFRNGSCQSDQSDRGNHSVCAVMTNEFLNFTKAKGNDLSTPNLKYGFPGLKQGDKWCLCAARWLEAKKEGIPLQVTLKSTHIRALEVTNDFNYRWKYRVLKCSAKLFKKQFTLLRSNESLTKELKLVVTSGKNKGCELIGLDGDVKRKSDKAYKLSDLEKIINQMPMRKAEMKGT